MSKVSVELSLDFAIYICYNMIMSNESLDLVQLGDEERLPSELMIDWMRITEGLPESWADWMPFLAFGVPYAQIAKLHGCDKSAITHALNGNKDFARRVAQVRKMVKRQLHYVWLDQKAVAAWKNIDYYLALDPLETDEEGQYVVKNEATRRMMFQEKAKMTRFVLQQLGLHIQRHEVVHHAPQPMFLGDETLAQVVVERVRDLMAGEEERDVDVIASEYRYIEGVEVEDYAEVEPVGDEEESEAPYDRKSKMYGFS